MVCKGRRGKEKKKREQRLDNVRTESDKKRGGAGVCGDKERKERRGQPEAGYKKKKNRDKWMN